MPGLYGIASFDLNDQLPDVQPGVPTDGAVHRLQCDFDCRQPPCLTIASVQSNIFAMAPAAAPIQPVSIFLEGWVADIDGCGPASHDPGVLHDMLAALYRCDGPRFVERLHGSFTLVLRDAATPCICLFADHTASRPLFWAIREGRLIWAGELSSFFRLPGMRWELALSSAANFVSFGHHLGETTWLKDVHQVGPGQAIVWFESGVRRQTYFAYQPGIDANPDDQIDVLADDLVEAVRTSSERCLRAAPSPVVTLSGGLDSRLVLGALLDAGARDIRTTTWGCENDYVHGDAHLAARLAGFLGLEHRFIERHDDPFSLSAFTRLFGAETDAAAYHIGEPDVLDRMLRAGWPPAIYRGDECFGWLGEVDSTEEALAAVGLRPLDSVLVPVHNIFRDDAWQRMIDSQRANFDHITASTGQVHPVDLKDRFYLEHRLARYLHPGTHYKRSRVEVLNPLLGKDVLKVLRRVPPPMRLYKRIEERVMTRHFSRLMRIPLASRASVPDATQRWREDASLRGFMLDTLQERGPIWSRLIDMDHLGTFAAAALDGEGPAVRHLRRIGGRLLRTCGVYEHYRRRTWRPLDHAQPSPMQILQRLLVMRVWLRSHEDRLTMEV